MKKVLAIIAILVVLGLAYYLLTGTYRDAPLHGRLKTASVTMTYFSPAATNSDGVHVFEKTVTIQEPTEVAALEKSLMDVRGHLAPANSMEGWPKYRMKVEYADGSTEEFGFNRGEWAGGRLTPPSLLEILKRNGL